MPQQLKPACLEPMLCKKRSHRSEKSPQHSRERPPLTATRESLCSATRPSAAKTQVFVFFFKEKNKKDTARYLSPVAVTFSSPTSDGRDVVIPHATVFFFFAELKKLSLRITFHWKRLWQLTLVFFPGESHRDWWASSWGCRVRHD